MKYPSNIFSFLFKMIGLFEKKYLFTDLFLETFSYVGYTYRIDYVFPILHIRRLFYELYTSCQRYGKPC